MWRDLVKIHPAADLFPMMSQAELQELARDIRENRLRHPIVFWTPETSEVANTRKRPEEVYLIDGRNRLAALELAWADDDEEREEALRNATYIGPSQDGFASLLYSDVDPYAYVVSANIRRRHLTAEQKREIIAELLRQKPERSDRATAQIVGVSHHTVASVRGEEEGRGQIAHVDTRTDTIGRQQPATKPSASVVKLPTQRTVDASEANASDKRVDAFIRAAKNLSDDEFTVACNWFDEYRTERGGTVFDNTSAGRR